jgi:V8-like Glu-specific endopeptidase
MPIGHSGPRERAPWLIWSPPRAALVIALAVGAILTLTPANGAAGDIATGFVRAVRHLAAPSSRAGQAFTGTPQVGALFTTSAGQLNQHFCTAAVVDSPSGDLVITAAHCVSGTTDTLDFVPGYNQGSAPYGVWTVTKVYVDQAWSSSSSQDDDFAFLRVSKPGSSVPVENVTGAERLDTNAPADRELVQVIGYPNATNQPVTCQNRLREPMTDQLEFDCDGYTDGTSGGPFLSDVDQASGQGLVIGVIGGYQQGGDVPQVSYSAVLGANAAALYEQAVAGG